MFCFCERKETVRKKRSFRPNAFRILLHFTPAIYATTSSVFSRSKIFLSRKIYSFILDNFFLDLIHFKNFSYHPWVRFFCSFKYVELVCPVLYLKEQFDHYCRWYCSRQKKHMLSHTSLKYLCLVASFAFLLLLACSFILLSNWCIHSSEDSCCYERKRKSLSWVWATRNIVSILEICET